MNALRFVDELYAHAVSLGPSNKLFSDLRYRYYAKKLRRVGETFFSCTGFTIDHPENVSIGNNVYFNRNVFIATLDDGIVSEITIGDNCLFGPNVVIVSGDHDFSDINKPIRQCNTNPGKIIIEDDCWVGSNVTITSGVNIGKGSVIGAGSVVTKDIPPHSVAVGTPAKVIKRRCQ